MGEGHLSCFALRLQPGEELKSGLANFIRTNGLKAAFVMTCVGSVTRVHLRMAHALETKLYSNGPYEIVSLVGTLSGGTSGHLHASLSDNDGAVFGGHVLGEMMIHTTAEVVIGNIGGVEFMREPDKVTGYDELSVKYVKNSSGHAQEKK